LTDTFSQTWDSVRPSLDYERVVDALKAAERSAYDAVSPAGARSPYQIIQPTFHGIRRLRPDLPEIQFSDLSKKENEPVARQYAKAIVEDIASRSPDPKDIAAVYNSGKTARNAPASIQTDYIPRFLSALRAAVSPSEAQAADPGSFDAAWDAAPSKASDFDAAWGTAPGADPVSLVNAAQRKADVERTAGILAELRKRNVIAPHEQVSDEEQRAIAESFQRGMQSPMLGAIFESGAGRLATKATTSVAGLFGPEKAAEWQLTEASREAYNLGREMAASEGGVGTALGAGAFRIGPDIGLLRAVPGVSSFLSLPTLGAGTAALTPGATPESVGMGALEGLEAAAAFGLAGKAGQVLAPSGLIGRATQVGLQGLAGEELARIHGAEPEERVAQGLLGGFFGLQSPVVPELGAIPMRQRPAALLRGTSPASMEGAQSIEIGQRILGQGADVRAAQARTSNISALPTAVTQASEGLRAIFGQPPEEQPRVEYPSQNPRWLRASPSPEPAAERAASQSQVETFLKGGKKAAPTEPPSMADIHLSMQMAANAKAVKGEPNHAYMDPIISKDLIIRRLTPEARAAMNAGLLPDGTAKQIIASAASPKSSGRQTIETMMLIDGRTVVPSGYEGAILPAAGELYVDRLGPADVAAVWDLSPQTIRDLSVGRREIGSPERAFKQHPLTRALFDVLDRRIDPAARYLAEKWLGAEAAAWGNKEPAEADVQVVNRVLDGKSDAKVFIQGRPDLMEVVGKLRSIYNEVATVFPEAITPERNIGEYFPHMTLAPNADGNLVPVHNIADLPVDVKAMIPKKKFLGSIDKDRTVLDPTFLDYGRETTRIYLRMAARKAAWDQMGGTEVAQTVDLLRSKLGADHSVYKYTRDFVVNYLGRNREMQNRIAERALERLRTNTIALADADPKTLSLLKRGVRMVAKGAVRSGAMENTVFAPLPVTRFGELARTIEYNSKIGGNFNISMINSVQPWTHALPKLSTSRAGKYLGPQYGTQWLVKASLWRYLPQFRAVREFMQMDGILTDVPKFEVEPQFFRDLYPRVQTALGWTFARSEQNNRGKVYTAGFLKTLHETAGDVKAGRLTPEKQIIEARRSARDLVNQTQFRGGRLHTPMFGQLPLAGLAFQFKQFGTKTAELFWGDMTKPEKVQFIGTLVMLAGPAAIPILGAFDPENDEWPSLAKVAGVNLSDQYGLSIMGVPRDLNTLGDFMIGPFYGDVAHGGENIGKAAKAGIAGEYDEEQTRRLIRSGTRFLPAGAQINRLMNPDASGMERLFGTQFTQK